MGPVVRVRFREVLEPVEPIAGPSAEARLLAMAYAVEQAVEGGRYRSVAEVARALGVSRARLSQVMRRRWAPVGEQNRWLGARRTSMLPPPDDRQQRTRTGSGVPSPVVTDA
jgi:Arc/MetJ-type ribon-helix-helix transcriptional regulator